MEEWRGFKWRRGRVRLIKLHGSVDWWRARRGTSEVDVYVRLTGDDPTGIDSSPVAARGSHWVVPDASPEILVGTYNKILDYTRPFHLDSLVVFRRALMATRTVVVSGYSFRDKGVNTLLIDWCNKRSKRRRLVVVDPNLVCDTPPDTARGAIEKHWRQWVRDGRLRPVKARFDECAWPSLRA